MEDFDIKECPKCKSDKIIRWTCEQISREYSVKTGKCIKSSKANRGAIECWGFKCSCGWESETFTE